jgi:excisionase family DNA binding protein
MEPENQPTNEEGARTLSFAVGRSVAIDHAALLLGVSRRTIYNRIRDGQLQTIRTLGGSQRVTLESLNHLGGYRRHSVSPPVAVAASLSRRPA